MLHFSTRPYRVCQLLFFGECPLKMNRRTVFVSLERFVHNLYITGVCGRIHMTIPDVSNRVPVANMR